MDAWHLNVEKDALVIHQVASSLDSGPRCGFPLDGDRQLITLQPFGGGGGDRGGFPLDNLRQPSTMQATSDGIGRPHGAFPLAGRSQTGASQPIREHSRNEELSAAAWLAIDVFNDLDDPIGPRVTPKP